MEPIINISRATSTEGNENAYHVNIPQGGDQIRTKEDLIAALGVDSVPAKQGLISVERLTSKLWLVITHKN